MKQDIIDSVDARLAIHGGPMVRPDGMPPRIALGPAEEAAILECIAHYRNLGLDPGYQNVFEERYCAEFAHRLGGGHADLVSTGTAALFIAIRTLHLPEGSEVLVSPITDPGTISAIILNGLRPKLIDSAPNTLNIGLEQVEQAFSPQTRAIVVVHCAGQAAPVDEIVAFARAKNILVVEDCSQSHGASLNGRCVGTFGDIAAFSTMHRKAHMTGGSGGLVFSRDEEMFQRALAHADRGKPRWRDDFNDRDPNQFLFPALNFHSDEISAAIGLSSIRRLDATIQARRAFIAGLEKALTEVPTCEIYPARADDSPFIYPLRVRTETISCSKVAFGEAVFAEGIGLNPDYKYLVADWPFAKNHLVGGGDTPNARKVIATHLCLYVNENYGAQEVADCITALNKVSRHFRI
ncbi:MAG: DegT/DnrJ/EryC1/StrS family aminotransferase [Rhodospirillales bacterium]